MKKIVIIASLVAFAGLLTFRIVQARNRAKPAEVVEKIFPVRIALLETQDLPRMVVLTGSLRPQNEVKVAAKVPGRIDRILADIGDVVRRGSPLTVLEQQELRLQLKQVQAAVGAAKVGYQNAADTFKRSEKLAQAGAASDAQLDGARAQRDLGKAQLEQAEAAVGLVREQLRNASVVSPINGVVTKRMSDVGQLVMPGVPLYEIQDSSVLKFSGGIEASDAVVVKKGTAVIILTDSYPGQYFQGKVARISPSLDPVTRRAALEIEVPNKNGKLLGNMFARGVIELGKVSDALAVPTSAVHSEGPSRSVFIVENGKAVRKAIEVSFADEKLTVIAQGLEAGAQVVVAGHEILSDGVKVQVESDSAEAPKAP